MPTESSATHIPRSTPALIAELRLHASGLTLAAIAVVNNNSTHFVFPTDGDPLTKLNALIHAGGHPVGIIGAQIGRGAIRFDLHPFVEFQDSPQALQYLHTLRDPFLALIRMHVDRMPDNPRYN
ncbi:MAG TPA: hypothetical protein VEU07_13175 [Candidatus Acidoferrum sp.]|nr:hypothetical protein [Candidatus Acidoferrum sp.]